MYGFLNKDLNFSMGSKIGDIGESFLLYLLYLPSNRQHFFKNLAYSPSNVDKANFFDQ